REAERGLGLRPGRQSVRGGEGRAGLEDRAAGHAGVDVHASSSLRVRGCGSEGRPHACGPGGTPVVGAHGLDAVGPEPAGPGSDIEKRTFTLRRSWNASKACRACSRRNRSVIRGSTAIFFDCTQRIVPATSPITVTPLRMRVRGLTVASRYSPKSITRP